jgi:hypothetical protein
MSETGTVTEPQTEGAVAELARDDVARKKFLKMAGRTMGSGAAATALGAFIAACGSSKSSSSTSASSGTASSSAVSSTGNAAAGGSGDLAIVNYALTLEYLEDQFYAKVIASGLFSGKNLQVIKTFGAEEHEHTLALHKVAMQLGMPASKPVGRFPLGSAAAVTKLAATVENLGAAAYLGQAPNIKDKQILAAALAIHSVEARHAATLNAVLGKDISPDGAFAKPADMATVLAAVKPFIA